MAKENIKLLKKQLEALKDFKPDANVFMSVPKINYKLYDGTIVSLNDELEEYVEDFLKDNTDNFIEIEKLKVLFSKGYDFEDVVESEYPIDQDETGLDYNSITFKRFLLEVNKDGGPLDGDLEKKISRWNALKFNREFLNYFKEEFGLKLVTVLNEDLAGKPLAFALDKEGGKLVYKLIQDIEEKYLIRKEAIGDEFVDLKNGFEFYHNIMYKDIMAELYKLGETLHIDIESLDPDYFEELKSLCNAKKLTYKKIEESTIHACKIVVDSIKDRTNNAIVEAITKALESGIKEIPGDVKKKFRTFQASVIKKFEDKFIDLFKEVEKYNFDSKILMDKPNKKGFVYDLYETEYAKAITDLHSSDYSNFRMRCENVYNVLVKFQALLELCSRSQERQNYELLETQILNTDAQYIKLKSDFIKSIEEIVNNIQKVNKYPVKFKNPPVENGTINYNSSSKLLNLCDVFKLISSENYLLEKDLPQYMHSIFYGTKFKFVKHFELMSDEYAENLAKGIGEKYGVEIDMGANKCRAKEFIWRLNTGGLKLNLNGYVSEKEAKSLVKEYYNINQNE